MRLVEAYRLIDGSSIDNLSPGTAIQVLDKSPGAPAEGAWLDTRIVGKLKPLPKSAGGRLSEPSGYSYRAPWLSGGESFVYNDQYGKSWRLVDVN